MNFNSLQKQVFYDSLEAVLLELMWLSPRERRELIQAIAIRRSVSLEEANRELQEFKKTIRWLLKRAPKL